MKYYYIIHLYLAIFKTYIFKLNLNYLFIINLLINFDSKDNVTDLRVFIVSDNLIENYL